MSTPTSDERITDLEVKISHQEMTIDALQTSVYELLKTVTKLEEQINRLDERARGAADGLEIGPANEKPPHY